MSRSLRFASVDDLPPHLRARAQQEMDKNAAAKSTPEHVADLATGTPAAAVKESLTTGAVARSTEESSVVALPKRAHKYAAEAVVVDGIRFDSKREARVYLSLKARQATGEVAYFLRQVPIHLPGGTKLVIDFLIFFAAGRPPQYLDAKGVQTDIFKLKKREVEHHYPIQIEVV